MSAQAGEVLGIAVLSLKIALAATIVACLLGIPFGFFLGWTRFAGRRVLLALLNTALALPTVVIGLLSSSMPAANRMLLAVSDVMRSVGL